MEASAAAEKPQFTLPELLEDRNLTKVARKLSVDIKTVARWRDNQVVPSGDKLQALARYFGIDANQIDLSGIARVAS